jgi:serine/threonine-protein kinase PpkA
MADFELPGYELYERLGRGGMATVYRALHLNLDREVAIKLMDPAMNSDENFSERFIREARISARLTHPHILQIYDVNTFEGLNYIAMELLRGGELADFIHGGMEQKQIYLILQQMTDALDYASGRGYIHRDIKPSNIMRRSEEDFVLADFGIARAANSGTQMTQTGLMVGTPSYMSPEQAKGQEVDGRSDLYALAVLAYEMLTKTLPYESDSAVTTAVKHLTEAIPTLPEHLSAYQGFLDKGLAKSADERFQTGREMYQSFMEASKGFADSDVLTEGIEPAQKTSSSAEVDGLERTSLAGVEATRMSHSSSPAVSSSSRPYRLDGSTQRERLVSGTFDSGRQPAKTGNSAVRMLAIAAVLGGLGYGGFVYWQGQQGGGSKDLANVTAELATAYNAMNEDKLQAASASFYKVLEMDSSNAAAKQGMAQIESLYTAAIEAALAEQEISRGRKLLNDFAGYFAGNSNLERYQAELDLLEEQQNLAAVQAQRIQKLVDDSGVALDTGDFARAGSLLEQASALDADSELIATARDALKQAEAQAIEDRLRWASYSEQERQAFDEALARADASLEAGDLNEAKAALDEAETIASDATELIPRQERVQVLEADMAAAAAQEQSRIDALLQEANEAVAAIPSDPANAQRALDIYAELESADPGNVQAEQGIASVVDYFLGIAGDAAADGDFAAARGAVASAEQLVPGVAAVSAMSASIDKQETAEQEQQVAAAQAREEAAAAIKQAEEVAARGQRALSSGALDVAQQAYDEVSQSQPELAAVKTLENDLKAAYAAAAREQIDLKEFDAAKALVAQASGHFPDDADWPQLEEEIETARSNSRRRLGAY